MTTHRINYLRKWGELTLTGKALLLLTYAACYWFIFALIFAFVLGQGGHTLTQEESSSVVIAPIAIPIGWVAELYDKAINDHNFVWLLVLLLGGWSVLNEFAKLHTKLDEILEKLRASHR